VFIGAGYAWGGDVALGYIATILAIFTVYVRAAAKIAGSPDEFCGPMAKQHRMLVITIACLYSVIVPRSWQIFHLDGLDVGIISLALTLIIAGCVITVVPRYKRIRIIPRPLRIKLIVGEPLNFAATPNNREGWSQTARNLGSRVGELAAR